MGRVGYSRAAAFLAGVVGPSYATRVTDDQIAHQVLRAIRRIVRRISQHSKHLAEVSGLNVPQLLCLKAVGDLVGVERYVSLPTPLQEQFVQRLAALSADERRELLRALDRITMLMEAETLDAAPILTPGSDVKSSP